MTPDDSDRPADTLRETGDETDRGPDPRRRVIAGFRDRRALVRARREAVTLGCDESRITVVSPPRKLTERLGLARRLRDHFAGDEADAEGPVLDECLMLLRRRFMLVFVEARSIPERACLEETFAEHGGLILGREGQVFPDGEAVDDEGAGPGTLRAAQGEDR